MNKETEIIARALENLGKAGITGHLTKTALKDVDGEVDLLINDQHCQLLIDVKRELRNHQVPHLQLQAQKYKNRFLVVAENIFPKIKEDLRQQEIPYVEANGNIWFKKGKTFIFIDTNKEVNTEREQINRAFTKTGLKVVFHLLLHPENINQTYREMANITGVALGNINYIVNGLKEEGYLLKLNKTKYKLVKQKELLAKWVDAYQERLKPTLFVGAFKFLKQEDYLKWKQLTFNTNTVWGGEPAGGILTNYLKPGEFTIYTNETKTELMKNYHLVPDPKGNIKVYQKFWNENETKNTAPPLLVYTDLINTGDPRNIETAEKIVQNVDQDKL